MPIYEYECSQCRARFEVKQSFFDTPFSTCPHCQSSAHRVFHPVGIVFKGSGFYSTDNRRSNGNASSSRASGNDASEKEDTKAEKVEKPGKPETKVGAEAPSQ
ncbi:MAG: hypothetical protein HYU86_02160 [Chloroflexi bacterium]|nr:hypothetical protein [Chloroflexota bacterium]